MMQFVIHRSSIIAPALEYVLKSVMNVPTECIETTPDGPHCVTVDGRTFCGLQPMVQVLRRLAINPQQKAFLGEEEQIPLVNQWITAAAVMDVDAARFSADGTASVAKALLSDVERIFGVTGNASAQFLTSSDRATIADVLVYAAFLNHPAHSKLQPATMNWAAHAQEDANLATVRSSEVRAAAPAKAGKANASAAKSDTVYVKPTEEEILRRRAEKEKAKAEKAAAAAAAAAAATGTAPKSSKAAPSPNTAAQDDRKGKHVEVDSTCLYLRVGQFTNMRCHPDADRLYVEDMNLGDETRTIVSGLVEHYTAEELEGSLCLVVCNMKPKALMGVTSHGMVLCAKRGKEVKLVRPPMGSQPGDRILFGHAYDATTASMPGPPPMSGNKMSEALMHLHTDASGILCWKEATALSATGETVAIPEMPDCPVN